MREILSSVWEIVKILIIALLVVIPIRIYLFQPFLVRGQSMEPNLANGDYLIVDEISYRFREPARGEIIVFKYPDNPSQRYVKRIVSLPGEVVEVKNGQVMIEANIDAPFGTPLTPFALDESSYLLSPLATPGEMKIELEEDEYFVLGDNRPFSSDSRRWGALSKDNIIGRVLFRLWPVPALAKIPTPAY